MTLQVIFCDRSLCVYKFYFFPVCAHIDEKVLRPCVAFNKRRTDVSETGAVNEVYDAACTENGQFAPLQCNVDSGNCWCVDMKGIAVAGTTVYQRPYCGEHVEQVIYIYGKNTDASK